MSEHEKIRYTDSELVEFRELLHSKLKVAREEYNKLHKSIQEGNENGTDSTNNSYVTLEDGADTMEKENSNQLAGRLSKFINNLEAALVRIENKTYGLCKVTGKLIPKERLRAVPHTTMSIEAKMNQK